MAKELLIGIQTNGVMHRFADGMPDIDTRFRMVREAGVFDYVDKTPLPEEVDAFRRASERYGLPVRAGGWFYTLGRDEELMARNLELSAGLGSLVHNTQILTEHADGHRVTDQEVVDAYLRARDIGGRLGIEPCLEVHVNMWSEDFRRVARVARAVEARGVPFSMTLDHSHVIFKIDNPEEQEVQEIRPAVESGELILDPFTPGNVCAEWIDSGWVRHAHARAAVPNNPKNVAARHPDGRVGRGIQYPFVRPGPDEYHAEWDEAKLEPWKEVVRRLLRHHATHPDSRLGQISTEFIPNTDYGEGCRYSIFEQGIACAEWIRRTWTDIQAETAAAEAR